MVHNNSIWGAEMATAKPRLPKSLKVERRGAIAIVTLAMFVLLFMPTPFEL